jgi:hypothetical protein
MPLHGPRQQATAVGREGQLGNDVDGIAVRSAAVGPSAAPVTASSSCTSSLEGPGEQAMVRTFGADGEGQAARKARAGYRERVGAGKKSASCPSPATKAPAGVAATPMGRTRDASFWLEAESVSGFQCVNESSPRRGIHRPCHQQDIAAGGREICPDHGLVRIMRKSADGSQAFGW